MSNRMQTEGHPIIDPAQPMEHVLVDMDVVDRKVADREVDGRQAHEVTLRRTYDASIDEVWSACTEADRIARWMLPVTGDLRLGGHYQLEGNAGGEILECEPPERFKITWIFGDPGPDPFSEVEVRLVSTTAGQTTLTLTHTAVVDPAFWGTFGPGSIGVGYDLTLVGLAAHLAGIDKGDPEELDRSHMMRDFMTRSAARWREADEASGVAADVATARAEATRNFYVPQPDATSGG